MSIPYERIIQWAAGPVSIAAGVIATKLVGASGAHHTEVADAVDKIGVFGVSAAVTFLAHQKWLTNVTAWYFSQQSQSDEPLVSDEDLEVGPPATLDPPTGLSDPGAAIPADKVTSAGFTLADVTHDTPPV